MTAAASSKLKPEPEREFERKQLQAVQNEHLACRWIEGDPHAQHTYCGAETKQGSSYCAEHHARAYFSLPLKPIAILKNAFGEA